MFVHPSDLPLKRAINIREPGLDETGAQNAIFRSDFLRIANKPMDFTPHNVHPADHDMRQRQLPGVVF
jgi:hypothetical protein